MVLPSPLEYIVLYQASKSLTLRLVVIVMAGGGPIAVGTPITGRPPHRTVRAAFPHTAPTSGV
jgi:hypothetical protein